MQMKNTFLFSLGIILSATLGMAVSTSAFTSDDDLLESLFSQAGVTQTGSNDAKELETLAASSDGSVPFQNLYLFMLQNVMDGPQEAAIQVLSQRYLGIAGGVKYSEEELSQVVLEGNTQVIIDKYETLSQNAGYAVTEEEEAKRADSDAQMEEFVDSNDFSATTQGYLQWKYGEETQYKNISVSEYRAVLSNTGLFAEYASLVEDYKTELELQMSNRKLTYQALAAEMFYNNDLSDSANIDILYDLDIINYLLFGEYIVYPDRSGDAPVELSSATPEPQGGGELKKEEDVALSEEVILAEETEEESVDPYTCLENDAIVAALETYEEDPPEVADVEIEEDSSIDYDLGDEEKEDAAEEKSVEGEVDVGSAMQELDGFITALGESAGDWTRSLPCDDLFCITVEFVTEKDDPTVKYEAADNCISCHVAYISKRMTETTSKSLVPSKISMNNFEDATCKEAGNAIDLDLNVYLIKKPIDLDPGDDLDTIPKDDTAEFKQTLWASGAIPIGGQQKTILGDTLGDKVCKAILSLNDTGDFSRPADELLTQCQDAAEQIEVEIDSVYEEFIYNAQAKPASDLYAQVSAEFYSMLIQFKNFQNGLKDTYENENAPLPELIVKPYCT